MDIGIPSAATLDSRLEDLDQPVLLTGIQALLRLFLEQRRLDALAGLRTAGFEVIPPQGGYFTVADAGALGGLKEKLEARLKNDLGLSVEVRLVEEGKLDTAATLGEGKAKRLIERRPAYLKAK